MTGWDGRPQNPERDGPHWVTHPNDVDAANGKMAVYWNGHGRWLLPGMLRPLHPAEMVGYLYHGPCLTPFEVAAQVAAARREGIEAALAAARKVLCDAEQLDICDAVDAVGDACDAIRALLPGDAALARDFAAWTEGESDE